MAEINEALIPSEVKNSKAYKFAKDVTEGRIVSGQKRIAACNRFLRELEQSYSDPTYPWEFDIEKGCRPIEFMERFLIPTKGAYSKMEILPWQCFVECNMYGWV